MENTFEEDYPVLSNMTEQRKYEYFYITSDGEISNNSLYMPVDIYITK